MKPCWRLVSSRFPPRSLFDRVANQADFDIISEIEGLTNNRLRHERKELSLIPIEDRVFGPGTTPIMAAFTHLNSSGSRFSDGSYGVYYAAKTISTAIEETKFHKERFLRYTNEVPTEIDMRSYSSNIDSKLHDIRGQQTKLSDIYNPDPSKYSSAQNFSKSLKASKANGIIYSSVRDAGGECVAIFRPPLLSPVKQGKHYCFVWDGKNISEVFIKTAFKP